MVAEPFSFKGPFTQMCINIGSQRGHFTSELCLTCDLEELEAQNHRVDPLKREKNE